MQHNRFEPINNAYNSAFRKNELSIGLVVPIENYSTSRIPSLKHQLRRIQLVERLGFKAIWLRDIPLDVPSFGDTGQGHDPFVYLGYLTAHTSTIALGVASIALPLRHPLHVAKSAASIDELSNGRLLLGIASGDRPIEYPAMGLDFNKRGKQYRDAYQYLQAMAHPFPTLSNNSFGQLNGEVDVLPKPKSRKIPLLITGQSQQNKDWIAKYGNGWMYYPRSIKEQKVSIRDWRILSAKYSNYDKPYIQPLYVDLLKHDDAKLTSIHLGIKTGTNHLIDYLKSLRDIGVNHVAINLRFNSLDIDQTLNRISEKVLPIFHSNTN